MPQIESNGIQIEYEVSGKSDGAPLLLIHGVGAQLIRWPDELLHLLAHAGFRTIRFDNRDVGLSTHMTDLPLPDIASVVAAQHRGEVPDLPYTLDDLAADAFGLLDALGIERAHLLGVSLGGMVAQAMALSRPRRIVSLTAVMTHAGNPDMPPSDPEALAILSAVPPDPSVDREAYISHSIRLNRALGGPDYPSPEETLRAFALRALERAYYPPGSARQLAAGRGAPDRRADMARLVIPTLVIHGRDDPLIPLAGGEDIARAIKGAWLLAINGMGHDLPPQLFELMVSAVKANACRAAG